MGRSDGATPSRRAGAWSNEPRRRLPASIGEHCRHSQDAQMGLLRTSAALAVCSTWFASAFINGPPGLRRIRVDASSAASKSRLNRVSVSSARSLDPRGSRRRSRPLSPPLLSSRTVDVDVIDVIDVTEEDKRRQKEQVCSLFAHLFVDAT